MPFPVAGNTGSMFAFQFDCDGFDPIVAGWAPATIGSTAKISQSMDISGRSAAFSLLEAFFVYRSVYLLAPGHVVNA
jgi:hypothetical protein